MSNAPYIRELLESAQSSMSDAESCASDAENSAQYASSHSSRAYEKIDEAMSALDEVDSFDYDGADELNNLSIILSRFQIALGHEFQSIRDSKMDRGLRFKLSRLSGLLSEFLVPDNGRGVYWTLNANAVDIETDWSPKKYTVTVKEEQNNG